MRLSITREVAGPLNKVGTFFLVSYHFMFMKEAGYPV